MRAETLHDSHLINLKRQNRYLKGLTTLSALAIGCLFLMGQSSATPKIISAEKFVLVDSSGLRRAELYPDKGNTVLLLRSSRQNSVTLTASNLMSSIEIEQANTSATLVAKESGECSLQDEDGDLYGGCSHNNFTVELKMQAHTTTASSEVEAVAGPIKYTTAGVFQASHGKIGWREDIFGPTIKLLRNKNVGFSSPYRPPSHKSGQ